MKTANWKLTLTSLGLALSTLLMSGCGGSSGVVENVNGNPVGGGGNTPPPTGAAPVYGFQVINTYPHQTDAYTQGLVYDNGRLYESTGLTGQSTLREVELNTGRVLREVDNDPTVFAEGLALRAGRLYQLTLSSGIVNVFNQQSFVRETTLPSRDPAWGLTYIPESDRFAFSDGSSTIRFLLPDFTEVGSVVVTDNGQEVGALNELEYVQGFIFANRYLTDEIVVIDPETGVIALRANLTGLINKQANGLTPDEVLNGIAFDTTANRLFVTGKNWPSLFEIELVQ